MKTWNERYRDYLQVINEASMSQKMNGTFDRTEVMRLYKELLELKETKDLSFGERKILDEVQNLLNNEVTPYKKYGHLFIVK